MRIRNRNKLKVIETDEEIEFVARPIRSQEALMRNLWTPKAKLRERFEI